MSKSKTQNASNNHANYVTYCLNEINKLNSESEIILNKIDEYKKILDESKKELSNNKKIINNNYSRIESLEFNLECIKIKLMRMSGKYSSNIISKKNLNKNSIVQENNNYFGKICELNSEIIEIKNEIENLDFEISQKQESNRKLKLIISKYECFLKELKKELKDNKTFIEYYKNSIFESSNNLTSYYMRLCNSDIERKTMKKNNKKLI